MLHKDDSPPGIAARTVAALLRDIVASGASDRNAGYFPTPFAVHDLRKALKRWRAILRLIAPMGRG